MLIALDTQDALTTAGYEVLGPAADITTGLAIVGAETIDAAVLDVSLGSAYVWPVAEALHARRVPMVLLSGYGAALNIPADLQSIPRLSKPVVTDELIKVVASLLQGSGSPPRP